MLCREKVISENCTRAGKPENKRVLQVLSIISSLREPPTKTIESLNRQEKIPVKIAVVAGCPTALNDLSSEVTKILCPSDMRLQTGIRVSKALNTALKHFDLKSFHYILKADDDVIFPPYFLKNNIEAEFDLMGQGYGLLIKVGPFVKLFGGFFKEVCADDVYLVKSFLANGLKVLSWKWICPAYMTKPHSYNWKRLFEMGKDYYRMGSFVIYFLLNSLILMMNKGPLYVFLILGYFNAILKHEAHYPIFNRVLWYEYNSFTKSLYKYFHLSGEIL